MCNPCGRYGGRRELLLYTAESQNDEPDPVGESVGSKVDFVLLMEGICILDMVNRKLQQPPFKFYINNDIQYR